MSAGKVAGSFMSSAVLFWLTLALKMTAGAALVSLSTYTAQRAGPLIGSLIATLPSTTSVAYVLIAIDHGDAFVAESALASLAINAVTAVFSVIYVKLAQRYSIAICIAAAMAAWLLMSWFVQSHVWTLAEALIFNILTFPLGIWLVSRERHAPMPRVPVRWYDLGLRAAAAAILVGAVAMLSFSIGATAIGVLAVFPIGYLCIMMILHTRVGGRASAAVIAHGLTGLAGFAAATTLLSLTAVPLGRTAALVLAFSTSVAWNAGVFALARWRTPAVRHV
jgi:hypothetical protein